MSKEDDVHIHPDEMMDTPFEESTVPLDGKETFPVKSPKMKRIKKLAGQKDKKQKTAKKAKAVKEQVGEDKESKKGKKEADLSEKKTAKRERKTGEKKSTGKTITEKTGKAEGKEKKPASKRQPKGEDETKERRTRRRVQTQEDIEVNPVVRDLVHSVLVECKSSHCTHPTFEHPNPGNEIYVMPYWSRNHVGVLVPKCYVKNPRRSSSSANPKSKPRKDRGSQVAYFSNETPCGYTNLLLAGAFVSCF